jgi:hypothetical protein
MSEIAQFISNFMFFGQTCTSTKQCRHVDATMLKNNDALDQDELPVSISALLL